ncbi:MAG: acyltransferase [Eubacteriales bacterium]|nr:acyltransferase [Eubacteriales bacterium]
MNEKYNGAIDFWKFIFCMVILIYHVGEYFGKGEYPFRWGMYAVEFFFVVSGYFMCVSAQSAKKRSQVSLGHETFGFVMHKLMKIFPAYLFAYVLAFIRWFAYSGLDLLKTKGVMSFVKALIWMLPDFLLTFMAGYEGKIIIRITWYISAMFIAMLVLYPLLRKYEDFFQLVIAPLIVLFLSGYLANTTHYNGIMEYEIIMTHGVMRAFIGLSLGCVVHAFSEYLKKQNFTRVSHVLLSVVELVGYGIILMLMYAGEAEGAYIINILLLFVVSITASKQAVTARLFDCRVSVFLGKMSLYVYLCQSPARALIKEWCDGQPYRQCFVYTVSLSFAFACLGLLVVSVCVKQWNNRKESIKKVFINTTK